MEIIEGFFRIPKSESVIVLIVVKMLKKQRTTT